MAHAAMDRFRRDERNECEELNAYLARQRWFGEDDGETRLTEVTALAWLSNSDIETRRPGGQHQCACPEWRYDRFAARERRLLARERPLDATLALVHRELR